MITCDICSLGSGDSKTKKDSKNKSVFTSLFKKSPKEKEGHSHKTQERPTLDPKITNVEFKFKNEVIDLNILIIYEFEMEIDRGGNQRNTVPHILLRWLLE